MFHLDYVYSCLMVNHDYIDASDYDIDDDAYLNLDPYKIVNLRAS